MLERSKLQSYLGFSIRAGKLVTGVNAIECTHKRIYALVMCKSAAKNTRKDAEKLRDRLQVPLCIADDLAEAVKKENCKLCAMLDRSLAEAVIALFADEAIAPLPRGENAEERIPLTSEEKPFYRAERKEQTEKAAGKTSSRNTMSGERNGFARSDGAAAGSRSGYGNRSRNGKPRSFGKYVSSDSEPRKEFRKRTSDGATAESRSGYGDRSRNGKPRSFGKYASSDSEPRKEFRKRTSDGAAAGSRSGYGDRSRSGKPGSFGKYASSEVRERNASAERRFGTVRNGTAKEFDSRANGKSRRTFGNQTKTAGVGRGNGAVNRSREKYNRPTKSRSGQKES